MDFLPTSFHHAYFVTLPKAASLAALPPIPVNSTLIGCWAHIVIVTWNRRKSITFKAPHSSVPFKCKLFGNQEHSIPLLNGYEIEKIRIWHLSFVIAMETIGFFRTVLPLKDLSICWSITSQTWVNHWQKINLPHKGRCTWSLYTVSYERHEIQSEGKHLNGHHKTLKTNLSESKFHDLKFPFYSDKV